MRAYRARVVEVEVTEGEAVAPLERDALAGRPGQALGPYSAGNHAALARVLAVQPGRPLEFREARAQVEQRLLELRRRSAVSNLVRDLRARYGYRVLFRFRGTPPPRAYPMGR